MNNQDLAAFIAGARAFLADLSAIGAIAVALWLVLVLTGCTQVSYTPGNGAVNFVDFARDRKDVAIEIVTTPDGAVAVTWKAAESGTPLDRSLAIIERLLSPVPPAGI